MEEFVKKDYTEAIEALESGMLDTSDLGSYIDIILHSLYVCRNQCAEDDEFKITPEEAEKLMRIDKQFMCQATPTNIKLSPDNIEIFKTEFNETYLQTTNRN